jgi:hypothetical protein
MVLEADKSEKTGWGVDHAPGFHAKYNHFLGYVYFRSKDVSKLPWTTTKEGIDRESPVYQAALAEMRILARPILDFLNNLYSDVKEESEPERRLLDNVKPVSTETLARRKNTPFEAKVESPPEDQPVSIQYKRTRRKLDKVRHVLRRPRMSASDLRNRSRGKLWLRFCCACPRLATMSVTTPMSDSDLFTTLISFCFISICTSRI